MCSLNCLVQPRLSGYPGNFCLLARVSRRNARGYIHTARFEESRDRTEATKRKISRNYFSSPWRASVAIYNGVASPLRGKARQKLPRGFSEGVGEKALLASNFIPGQWESPSSIRGRESRYALLRRFRPLDRRVESSSVKKITFIFRLDICVNFTKIITKLFII